MSHLNGTTKTATYLRYTLDDSYWLFDSDKMNGPRKEQGEKRGNGLIYLKSAKSKGPLVARSADRTGAQKVLHIFVCAYNALFSIYQRSPTY